MFTLQQIFILSLVKMKGLTTQAEKCTLSPSTADMLTIAAYKYKKREKKIHGGNKMVFTLSLILSNDDKKVGDFLGDEEALLNYYAKESQIEQCDKQDEKSL